MCVSSHKAIGKNILENKNVVGKTVVNNITFETRADGSIYIHGTSSSSSTTSYYLGVTVGGSNLTLPKGNYVLSGCPTGGGSNTFFQSLYYGNTAGNNFNAFDFGNGQTYTLDGSNNTGINVRIGIAKNATVDAVFYPMLRESGKSDEFVPYNGNSIPLDSSKDFRGLYKLVDGELRADGDIYEADGSVTRNYKNVTLEQSDWTYSDGYWASVVINDIEANTGATVPNIICNAFEVKSGRDIVVGTNNGIGQSSAKRLLCRNGSSSTAPNINVVDKLDASTSENATSYVNPRIVDADGTEEFVYYKVSQGTRDVAIPVGHESDFYDYTNGAITIPDLPFSDGTYTLSVTMNNGTPTFDWKSNS